MNRVQTQQQQQQQQQLIDPKRYEELVQDAKDFDPDKKFMAANDLSNALSNGQLKETDYDTVVKILLAQLNDDSSEVQGNSIRCLSKIINKLQESQVENVSTIMIQKVIEDKGEYRDVYATCLKTLINGVPSNYSKAVQPILLHAITGMEKKILTKEFDVQEELCDILTNLFKKWAQVLSTSNANVKNLTNILMKNILSGERNSLKKKSCSCLGSIGLILQKDDVGKVLKELLASIQHPSTPALLQAHLRGTQIYVVHALSAVSKTASRKLGSKLKELIQIILKVIKSLITEVDDYDLIVTISEIFEAYLSVLESLIKGSSEDIKEFFPQIIDLAAELINYDPNGSAQLLPSGDMEVEDGDEDLDYVSDDQDGDDQSWRVRRAALNLIETLVKSDSEMIKPIFAKCVSSESDQSTIVYRLGESNENIRFATFSCLQTIIRAIVISDVSTDKAEEDFDCELSSGPKLVRVKSAVKDFDISEIISEILSIITRIQQNEKKVSQAVLTGGFKLVEGISRNLSRQILSEPTIWKQAFFLISGTIQNKAIANELKVMCLSSLRRLIKNQFANDSVEIAHLQSDIPGIFQLITLSLKADYFKIVAEGFRCLSGLFFIISKQFSQKIQSFKDPLQQVLPLLMTKLQNYDIDQEIKQSSLSSTSALLSNLSTLLTSPQINAIIATISDKIKVETKKIPVLKLFKKIPLSVSQYLTKETFQHLNSSSEFLTELLAKQDRSLRVASLEALDNILSLLSNSNVTFLPKARDAILSLVNDFLNDRDTWVAQLYLHVIKKIVENSSANTQEYQRVIVAAIKFAASSIVSNSPFQSLYECFGIFAQKNIADAKKTIEQLIEAGTKDSYNSISCSVSAVISVLPAEQKGGFIDNIFTIAIDQKQVPLKRQICLASLGEIGKHINLCDKGSILSEIQAILNEKKNTEDIRIAASQALGGIAVGNLGKVLPQVIEVITSGKEGQYLMLNSLKSIIEHSQTLSNSILQIIPNLFQATATGDESLCNIVSDIIGRVALLNLKEMKALIIANLSSKNPNVKYTAASSFKYFGLKTLKIEADIRDLVSALVHCISEKDIRTRAAVLRSLNSIAFNIPLTIIQHVTKEEFFVPLQEALRFTQVREIDFGPFKQKNDDGEPVRNAAFTLLDTSIDHLHYRGVENFEREILEEALFEFANETSEDIKILRFQIITKFAHKVPLKITPFLDQISEVFLNVLKPYASKNDGDRAADMVRAGLICCQKLKSIAEDESNPKYLAFWDLVMKTEKFRNIINAMAN